MSERVDPDRPPAPSAPLRAAMAVHGGGDPVRARALYADLKAAGAEDPRLSWLDELARLQQGGWHPDGPWLDADLDGGRGIVRSWRVLGAHLVALKRPGDALECLSRAEAAFGGEALFCYHMGAALADLERFDEAEPWLVRALEIEPDHRMAHFELGNLFNDQGRLDEAARHLDRAVALDPDFLEAVHNLGGVLLKMGRPEDALACFNHYLSIKFDDDKVKGAAGLAMLALGRIEDGWKLHEYGLRSGERTRNRQDAMACERWNGQDLSGRAILVWPEQGIGDNLRYASCIGDLVERGARVTLLAETRLLPLFARSFPAVTVLSAQTGVRLHDFDYHIPIGSMPLYFRGDVKAFPDRAAHLIPDRDEVARWRARLDGLEGSGPRIGVCWRSQLATPQNRQHFTGVEPWAPLLKTPGAVFVNLQYDADAAEIAGINARLGTAVCAFDDIDLKIELDRAAALTAALDLVITVGTSVNDMAGAVGTECWVILFDWCPDLLGTDRLPWYPKARVFRRPWNRPWDETLGEIAAALAARLDQIKVPPSRNAPCPCGSGLRFKKCCGA